MLVIMSTAAIISEILIFQKFLHVRGFNNYLPQRYFPECIWLNHMVTISISGTHPLLSQNLRVRHLALRNKSTQYAEIQLLRCMK